MKIIQIRKDLFIAFLSSLSHQSGICFVSKRSLFEAKSTG
jgi:hypothetical protein